MPKKLQKSLQDYLSKIKKQAPHLQFSQSSISSTTSKIFSGCKHPKSLSFSVDRKVNKDHDTHHHQNGGENAATLEDIDRFLIENFKSLYGKKHDDHDNDDYRLTHEGEKRKIKEYHQENHTGPPDDDDDEDDERNTLFDSPRFFKPPPDLCGSHRFFISQSSSGSLLEEARLSGTGTFPSDQEMGSTSTTMTSPAIPRGIEDCIAVLTVSPSPYEDFSKSMHEMVEARMHHNQRVDWDFMEELLFCYLKLNEKKQYRYILSAFIDVVVILRQNSSNSGPDGSRSSDGENITTAKGKARGDF